MRNQVKAKLKACKSAGVAPGIAFGRDIAQLNELTQGGFTFIDKSDACFPLMECSEKPNRAKFEIS